MNPSSIPHKIRFPSPDSNDEYYDKEIYRLKIYYECLINLLDHHFSGYLILSNEKVNTKYLQLCIKIDEILNNPVFDQLPRNNWRLYENLLSYESNYPEEQWVNKKRKEAINFQSKIQELFIKCGGKESELLSEDHNFLNDLESFLEDYIQKKIQADEIFLDNVEEELMKLTQQGITLTKLGANSKNVVYDEKILRLKILEFLYSHYGFDWEEVEETDLKFEFSISSYILSPVLRYLEEKNWVLYVNGGYRITTRGIDQLEKLKQNKTIQHIDQNKISLENKKVSTKIKESKIEKLQAKSRYIFFMDMVGSSKPGLTDQEKANKKIDLYNKIQECKTFKDVSKTEDSFVRYTGDGMLIAVVGNTTFPIELAIELHKKLSEYNIGKNPDKMIKVRIGMHVGPVIEMKIIGENDISGDTIDLAKRIMDAGDENHILLSSKIAKELIPLFDKYRNIIHPLRIFTFKHGVQDELFSAYGEGFGNSIFPKKKEEEPPTNSEDNTPNVLPTQKIHYITLDVHSDKSVYPLGARIHIRARLPSIILGEPLIFSIYNSQKKLLVFRKLVPEKYDNFELKKHGIYQISIRMQGSDWKINEKYTITAKHGSAEAQDYFVVDRREPVLMTDRAIYHFNDYMIVTVIDPDENKDSEKIGTIGNRKYSYLSVSTSLGKIVKYKLEETGKNTGIFQGKIKILGPKYDKNKKRSSVKAKGKGPFDGEIPCHRGEQIVFTYSKPEKTKQMFAYSSNFGATISLDSKTYRCNALITITAVAPDYNYNSNKIDFIGDKPDNKITISTSIDSISNYKLKETKKDTGIFVGVVSLTCLQSLRDENHLKRLRNTRKNGPENGKLVADKTDKLKVIFETDSGNYEDTAEIK